jgi:hypothetical protein
MRSHRIEEVSESIPVALSSFLQKPENLVFRGFSKSKRRQGRGRALSNFVQIVYLAFFLNITGKTRKNQYLRAL